MQQFKPTVLIPVYNHEGAVGRTLERVLEFGLPVLLVDDGSSEECHQVLRKLTERFSHSVRLLTLPLNGGKGAAVKAGLLELERHGYSHAIQVDADGQHDLSRLPDLLDAARCSPHALVSGYPVYDESVPGLRYLGRYLTHVWVWINTLSLQVKDAMCGFRVYPIAPVNQLLRQESIGNRMDFDPEVMVRWCWRGYRVVNLPTAVLYPADGVSHFRVWRDNLLISAMHARLFFGMLRRFPILLWRKVA